MAKFEIGNVRAEEGKGGHGKTEGDTESTHNQV